MKWIGQHIYDNISRFRNDVYLEGTLTLTGDITATGDTFTFQSANADDPVFIIKNTNSNTSSAELHLVKDKGASGADGDEIGIIKFYGDNDAQEQTYFGHIKASIATAADSSEGGIVRIAVASHDGEIQNGLQVIDGDAEDEVDVTIGNGVNSITTITGKLACQTRTLGLSSAVDGNANGDVIYFGNTTSMTTGAIYHYNSSGTWELADADDNTKSDGLLGIALGAASDTNGVLLRGMVTLDHDPGAIGDVLYLTTTAGDCSATAPSGSGNIVRVIGYQVSHASNGNIWFNPDNTFIEVS